MTTNRLLPYLLGQPVTTDRAEIEKLLARPIAFLALLNDNVRALLPMIRRKTPKFRRLGASVRLAMVPVDLVEQELGKFIDPDRLRQLPIDPGRPTLCAILNETRPLTREEWERIQKAWARLLLQKEEGDAAQA
jgi:hypothetical protein